MKRKLLDLAVWCGIAACCFLLVDALVGVKGAFAHEPGTPHADWYKQQQINPEAQQRMQLGYKSCCDEADHFQTRFRLINDGTKYGAETYEYWTGNSWKVISPDIVQHKKTPDGRPVLFIIKSSGKEVCLIVDEGGI